jgi:hypothetical protein
LNPHFFKELCPLQCKLPAKKTNIHINTKPPQPHTHRTQEKINSSQQLDYQLLEINIYLISNVDRKKLRSRLNGKKIKKEKQMIKV